MKRRGSGSKQKGAQFERDVCRALSLWISDGKHEDLFWRSAMSGGRATVRGDGKLRKQAGDISAVSAEGCTLTDRLYLECKFYRDLQLQAFLFHGKGKMQRFWNTCIHEADRYKKQPLLIVKQNNLPPLAIMHKGTFKSIAFDVPILLQRMGRIDVVWFDHLMKCSYRTHSEARFVRELGLP